GTAESTKEEEDEFPDYPVPEGYRKKGSGNRAAAAGKPAQPAKQARPAAGREEKPPRGVKSAVGAEAAQQEQEQLAGAAEGTRIKFPSAGPEKLDELWQQRLEYLRNHDFDKAAETLRQFVELKEELELGNLYAHALVLVLQATRAMEARDEKRAERLLEAAERLAPLLPEPRLVIAWQWFKQDPLKPGRVLAKLKQAIAPVFDDPLAANRLVVNSVTVLLVGLLLGGMVFVVVQFLRYIRFFYHDFHHLLPRGVAWLQSSILATLLLLLPPLFGLGLPGILMEMVLVIWLYLQWKERVVSGVFVVLLVLLPFGLGWICERLQYPDTPGAKLWQIEKGNPSRELVAEMESALEAGSAGARSPVAAVLGRYYKRIGDFDKAERYYRMALEELPNSAELANNLANVLFMKKMLDDAVALYDQAIRFSPGAVEPYFNLSRVYYAKLELVKAKQYRENAGRLDEERLRQLQHQAATGLARYAVADMQWPAQWFRQKGRRASGVAERAAMVLWKNIGGFGTRSSFVFLGGGYILVLLLLLLAGGKWQLSLPCPRCGRPVCRKCDSDLPDTNTCGQCYHAFRKPDGVDPRARIEKEIQIRHRNRRLENVSRVFSFVLPGVGHIMKDKALSGAVLLALFSTAAALVLLRHGIMADPYKLGAAHDLGKLVLAAVIVVACWTWAAIALVRDRA
ncbi:MAG: hypothetical protein D6806_12530, partial [Deltaproteobacteria bacterium]